MMPLALGLAVRPAETSNLSLWRLPYVGEERWTRAGRGAALTRE